jgi:hypothetical protein
MSKRIRGLIPMPLVLGLLALFISAQPASAAVQSWIPSVSYPYPGNWHCTDETTPTDGIDVCLINSHNGVEPVYKAVTIVWNFQSTGFQMSSAVINMWALPSPSTRIATTGGYSLTANGAINIPAISPDPYHSGEPRRPGDLLTTERVHRPVAEHRTRFVHTRAHFVTNSG